MNIEKQELYYHNCKMHVQFDIDLSLNGNHILKCPNCQHEHCRVVKDGIITGNRWDSRNQTHWISSYATKYSLSSTWTSYTNITYTNSTSTSTTVNTANSSTSTNADNSNPFIYGSWLDLTVYSA